MKKNIAFRIENDFIGYLDLGFYDIPLADDYETTNSFYSFSGAIKGLFEFLESDNGKTICLDYPKSNFNILKIYASGKKDRGDRSVIIDKVVFKISAKEVENLRSVSSLENGGNFQSGVYDDGGEVEFIEYGDSEIMYEPHYKKFYANDMEFDNLEDAKKFIDSGEVPYFIKDAYSKGLFAGGAELKFGSYGEIKTKKFTDKNYEVIVNPEKLEIDVIITNKDTVDQEALENTGILFRKEDFGYSMEADNKTEYNKALKVLLGVAKRFESGGGVKRKMDLSDSVIYQDKVWYITEKNGVVGLMNFKQGSWGSNYPFIPLSRISQSEITDMMGREVEIPYLVKDFAYGGDFPDVGETIKGSDIDYDMKDYFNRTNKKLIITTKDNKIHTGGSVTKFYNDLIFVAKDKFDIPVRDILKVKILK